MNEAINPWHRIPDTKPGVHGYRRATAEEAEAFEVSHKQHLATVNFEAYDLLTAMALYREIIRTCPDADFPDVNVKVTIDLPGVSDNELAALYQMEQVCRSFDVHAQVEGIYYRPKRN